jgi:hypothetical protein
MNYDASSIKPLLYDKYFDVVCHMSTELYVTYSFCNCVQGWHE